MMPNVHLLSWGKMVLSITLLCLALPGQSAQAQTNPRTGAPGATPGSSKPVPAEAPVPISVFVMPAGPAEGKDPFFPHSMRPYTKSAGPTNQAPVQVVADLRLNGISGSAEKRLAIINNRTFEAGEEADVNSNAGKVHIRCVEIQADAVVVHVGGERRVLRLRPGS